MLQYNRPDTGPVPAHGGSTRPPGARRNVAVAGNGLYSWTAETLNEEIIMSDELEVVRGSDNPFEDVGLPDADTKLIKADLAAEIVGILRERHLTGAAAAKLVGIQTADMS